MFDHLDKLRAKSPAAKKQIAFFVSGGVTLLVALLWWGSFFGPEIGVNAEQSLTVQEAISPAKSILVSLKEAKDMTAEGIKKITDQATEETTATTAPDVSTSSQAAAVIESGTFGDMRKAAETNTKATNTAPSTNIPDAVTTWR